MRRRGPRRRPAPQPSVAASPPAPPTCSSTNRVCTRLRRRRPDGAAAGGETAGSSRRRRSRTRPARARPRAPRRRRSRATVRAPTIFASSESKRGLVARSRRSRRCRRGRRVPPAARTPDSMPPAGRALPSAPMVSVLTRSWIAKPRGAGEPPASPRSASERPLASSSCSRTRSTPGDLLGDGVLDLEARVGLDERERRVVAASRRVDQELERCRGCRAAPRAAMPQRGVEQTRAQRRRRAPGLGAISTIFWCRRCRLHSRSQGASRARCHRRPPAPRCGAPAATDARRRRRRCRRLERLGAAARDRLLHLVGLRHHAHAAPTAAGDGFDHDHAARSQALRGTPGLVRVDSAGRPGQDGDAAAPPPPRAPAACRRTTPAAPAAAR